MSTEQDDEVQPVWKVETCRSRKCLARIIFAECERTHKAIPIDADPTIGGTIKLVKHEGSAKPLAHTVAPKLAFGARGLRKRHIDTCPEAHVWRDAWKARSA